MCAGGRGYLPEILSDYRHLMHDFASFEAAMKVYEALPRRGTVIMLGGDMLGLDLALTLLDTGYKVTSFRPGRPSGRIAWRTSAR